MLAAASATPRIYTSLTDVTEATMAEWVRRGPTPEHKIVRWRCIDLRDEIAREFGVQLHERTGE